MMNQRSIIKTAIAISVIGHLAFFGASTVWQMPGMSRVFEKAQKMFNVRSVRAYVPAKTGNDVIQSYVKAMKFENPLAEAGGAPMTRMAASEAIEKPLSPGMDEEIRAELRSASQSAQLPHESADAFKERADFTPRKITGKTGPDVFLPAGEGAGRPGDAADEGIAVPADFQEAMFAFTPSAAHRAPVKEFLAKALQKGDKERGQFGSLDEFVAFRVAAWRDPSDGTGFFELRISPGKDAAKLAHMPKEIVFLIDASLSINEDRIREFKKGIAYCLRNLNEGDRFNIYTFKDKLSRFKPQAIPPDPGVIGPAIRFMDRLEPSQSTDLYEAFLDSIRTPETTLPSYLMLMSDGRPTQGETSSAKLIEEISRVNAMKRSIFAFSGGRRVNRYLLDFLAYQNRGWSEYASRTTDIDKRIAEFYDKIRDPLLRNLRFQFGQIDAREVFPKHLPDFYRNAEFVVYGTFKDEKEFSMRLVGEIGGRTKEIIHAMDMGKAEKGGPDIAKAWAFNKIYYLISRMTLEGQSEALKREVRDLSRKYGIQTPYDIEEPLE